MASKKFTVELDDRLQSGLAHAVDVANEQITADNEAIKARNESVTKHDGDHVLETEKAPYTPESYLQFVAGTWAESYTRQAATRVAADLTAKLADMDPVKRKKVEELIA